MAIAQFVAHYACNMCNPVSFTPPPFLIAGNPSYTYPFTGPRHRTSREGKTAATQPTSEKQNKPRTTRRHNKLCFYGYSITYSAFEYDTSYSKRFQTTFQDIKTRLDDILVLYIIPKSQPTC